MRSTAFLFILAAVGSAVPIHAQDSTAVPFFLQKRSTVEDALQAYREKPYRPVRVGEQRTAPFLSEGAALPFGAALGPTAPARSAYGGETAVVGIGSQFAVTPPVGGSYRPGDTLIVAATSPSPRGKWGTIVTPSGLLVVESVGERQTVAHVAAVFGPIRRGQVVLPAPALVDPGQVTPVAANGPTGTLLGPHTPRALEMSSSILFTDLGADDGVRVGDFVDIRRTPQQREGGADTIDESIGTAQIIHVGPTTSTIRVIGVTTGSLPDGSRVVRTKSVPQ